VFRTHKIGRKKLSINEILQQQQYKLNITISTR